MRVRSVVEVVVGVCAVCIAGCGDPALPVSIPDEAPRVQAAPPAVSPTCPQDNPFCCRHVSGTFTNTFLTGPDCAPLSPIEQCTQGQLQGDLRADYDFFFATQTPLPNEQQTFRFTGVSRVSSETGTAQSDDHGQIRFLENDTAAFTTFVELTEGTDGFAGAQGTLVAQGVVDLTTAEGSGTYEGVVCLPNPATSITRVTQKGNLAGPWRSPAAR